jgi:hypothetical protein
MMMFLGLLAGKYGTGASKEVVTAGEEAMATKDHPIVRETITPPEAPDLFRETPEIPPVEDLEPLAVGNEPEYEEDDDEDENEYEDDEDDGEDENEAPDTFRSEEAGEENAFETPDVPQIETAATPEPVERSEDSDNELVKKEKEDMEQSEPEEEVLEMPLKDEDFNDDFLIFEPLLDEAEVDLADETTEKKDIQELSTPEKQNEDNLCEKPAAQDEETSEDDAPLDYII